MSSFVVDSDVIDFLVTAVDRFMMRQSMVHVTYGNSSQSLDLRSLTQTEIGRLLWDANVAGVESEYDPSAVGPETRKRVESYRFRMWTGPGMSAVQVIKTCQFLTYQSMDDPNWDNTAASMLLQMLEHQATFRLPGWDEAAYGVPPRT